MESSGWAPGAEMGVHFRAGLLYVLATGPVEVGGRPMAVNRSRQLILPLAWGDVLGKVEAALERAVGQAKEAEVELARTVVPATRDAAAQEAWDERLRRLADRTRQWQESLARSQRETAAADAVLAAAEQTLRDWLASAASVGAGAASPAVSPAAH